MYRLTGHMRTLTVFVAATAGLQQRGVKIDAPRVGRTVSLITSTMDPYGVRMELSELGPESMLGKAIAGWK